MAQPRSPKPQGATVVRSERVIGKGGAVTLAHAALRTRGSSASAPEALWQQDEGDIGVDSCVLCDGDLGESAARLGPLVEAVHGGEADLAVAAFSKRVGGGFGLAVGFAAGRFAGAVALSCEPPSPASARYDGRRRSRRCCHSRQGSAWRSA